MLRPFRAAIAFALTRPCKAQGVDPDPAICYADVAVVRHPILVRATAGASSLTSGIQIVMQNMLKLSVLDEFFGSGFHQEMLCNCVPRVERHVEVAAHIRYIFACWHNHPIGLTNRPM